MESNAVQFGRGHVADTVFVVDPDPAVHDALTTLLGASGTKVLCFLSGEAFLKADFSRATKHDLALIDADLPGLDSLSLLRQLRSVNTELPVAVMSSTPNRRIEMQVIKAGACEVIQKPLVGEKDLSRLRTIRIGNHEASRGERSARRSKGFPSDG